MKKAKKLLSITLTLAMGVAATCALVACGKSYTTTETDTLVSQLQTTIDNNKSDLDGKIAELELADEANAEAIADIETEYLAKVEELENEIEQAKETIANNKTALENAVESLKTESEAKLDGLEALIDAIEDTDKTQEEKIEALERAISELSKKHVHDWGDPILLEENTCQKIGFSVQYCKDCGEDTLVVHNKAHSYTQGNCVWCGDLQTKGLFYTLNSDKASYTVTDIGTCKDTEIVIPAKVDGYPITGIGKRAFYFCFNLTSITIPDSVTSIGESAFEECDALTSITVSENNTTYQSIDGNLYTKGGKTLVRYAEGKQATEFTVPDSVTSIGERAFVQCNYLTSITLPDSVESIGSYAFYYNDSLTNVVIGDSVTSIGEFAFAYCDGLTSIIIPDSVTSIGESAFEDCNGLTSITVSENNTAYQSVDGNLYTKGGTTLVRYAAGKQTTEFTVPDSVTSIGEGAFFYCRYLWSITIPDSVTSIGSYAFACCVYLTSIEIPNSVTSIDERAFYLCFDLTSITVSENNTAYQSIEGNLYTKDGTTLIQYAIGKQATEFTVPDSVTSIGESAFYYCHSLTSVVIGDSVTSIGESAFFYCYSLTSIEIPNSVTSIDKGAFSGCHSLTIYCEEASQPSGWSSSWNSSDRPVYWYSETAPALNADGTAYNGNYWHYDESGEIVVWVYTKSEE